MSFHPPDGPADQPADPPPPAPEPTEGDPEPTEGDPEPTEGEWVVRTSLGGTALFTVTALAATVAPEPMVYLSVPVALALFVAGCGAFLLAYWNALQRSRQSLIGIGGLYFLVGCAPARVRNLMNLSLVIEVVVGLITASIRIFTPLAFGLLVPVWALGLSGLWASRWGEFPPRPPEPASAGGDAG